MPHDSCLHDSTIIIIIIFNNKTPNNFSIAAETDVFLLVKCFWLPFRYKADFKIYFSITTRKNEEKKQIDQLADIHYSCPIAQTYIKPL